MTAVEADDPVGKLVIGIVLQLGDGDDLLFGKAVCRNPVQGEELVVGLIAVVVCDNAQNRPVRADVQGGIVQGLPVDVAGHPVENLNRLLVELEAVEELAAGVIEVIEVIAGDEGPGRFRNAERIAEAFFRQVDHPHFRTVHAVEHRGDGIGREIDQGVHVVVGLNLPGNAAVRTDGQNGLVQDRQQTAVGRDGRAVGVQPGIVGVDVDRRAAQFAAVQIQHDDVIPVFVVIILVHLFLVAIGGIRPVVPACPLLFEGNELSVRIQNGTAEIAVG